MPYRYTYHAFTCGVLRGFSLVFLLATVVTVMPGWARPAAAQVAEAASADAAANESEQRQETLDWFDQYVTQSELMTPETQGKIREAIARMTPSQLEQWLQQTRQLRDFVASPQWQETRVWLRGFLRVQAIYSDQEIAEFREQLFEADADQMLEMLKRIQAKHESMVWMHQASQQGRQMSVDARNASVARQDATNKAAAQRASAARQAPLFGSTAGAAGGRPRDSGYRVRGPLIDSIGMARWTAFMGVW